MTNINPEIQIDYYNSVWEDCLIYSGLPFTACSPLWMCMHLCLSKSIYWIANAYYPRLISIAWQMSIHRIRSTLFQSQCLLHIWMLNGVPSQSFSLHWTRTDVRLVRMCKLWNMFINAIHVWFASTSSSVGQLGSSNISGGKRVSYIDDFRSILRCFWRFSSSFFSFLLLNNGNSRAKEKNQTLDSCGWNVYGRLCLTVYTSPCVCECDWVRNVCVERCTNSGTFQLIANAFLLLTCWFVATARL